MTEKNKFQRWADKRRPEKVTQSVKPEPEPELTELEMYDIQNEAEWQELKQMWRIPIKLFKGFCWFMFVICTMYITACMGIKG